VIYTVDAGGIITYLSPSAQDLLGSPPDAIIGRNFLDFIHPADHGKVTANFLKLLEGSSQLNEYRLNVASGKTVWVLISSKPLRRNGRIEGSCGILTEITGWKKSMESLIRESRINAEIARLGRIILSTDSIESISNQILDQVLTITGSRYGFLGYSEPQTSRIITPAVTADAFPARNPEDLPVKSGHYPGIERWLAAHNQPILENRVHPDTLDPALPVGHVPIHRFLSIPARIGNRPAGWIVVANKQEEYSADDIHLLEQIASLYSIAVSQRLMENSLKRSEERYRTTIDHLDDMIHVVDREFNVILYNKKVADNAEKYAGLKGSLLGCNIFEIFPFLKPEIRKAYREVLDTGQLSRTLDVTQVPDGKVYTEAQRIPVLDSEGNVDRIITILRDVTEYKRIEHHLKQLADELELRVQERTSELEVKNTALEQEIEQHRKTAHALDLSQELTKTFMSTPYIITILLEKNGDIVMCNDMAAKSMGSTPEKLIGRNVADVIGHDLFRQRKAHTKELFAEHKIIQFRDQRNGRWFDTTALPVLNPDGTLHRVAVIARDITDQKRMDEEILKNQKLESIGVLAGGIAHDFNNYLTGILGYINLVRLKTGLPEDARALLESAEKATLETRLLAQQLLTFSRGGAPVRRSTDLRDIIRDAVEFSIRGSNARYGIRIQDKPMPGDVDSGQIRQVIQNLVLNSIDAVTGGGHIDVRGTVRDVPPGNPMDLSAGTYNVIEVADDGCGISPEHLPRVFDPYFTTKPDGSGLGLAASHSIISNHEGAIIAESQPGQGAVFTIYLPVSQHLLTDTEEDFIEEYRGAGKILVMDDEPCVRDVFDLMLRELGHEAILTCDGEEAVREFRKAVDEGWPFRTVILDLTIPGGQGGVEILKKLREIDPEIKAIVTSGYSHDAVLATYTQYGFIDTLAKPFSFDDVWKVLQKIRE